MFRVPLPTALVLAAALLVPAGAAETSIEGVEVGFGGAYKPGQWTPLAVRARDVPPSVTVETVTADADGALVRRVSPPVAGEKGTVRAVFQSGRLGSDLTVLLRSPDGKPLAEQRYRYESPALPRAVPAGMPLWVTLGGLAPRDGQPAVPFPEEVRAASLTGAPPADRLAYAAADVLFLRGDLALSSEQAEAIRAWVAGGGHLAIALGRFTDEFRAGPLAKWVPVEVGETVQLLNLADLEEYAKSENLPRRARVRAAQLGDAAEVLTPGTPLIARGPYGLGRVTVFAIDLDTPTFTNWPGLPAALRRALLRDEAGPPRGDRVATPGLTDLSTQLLRAEETFPGAARPTTGDALLALLAYAAVIGPLDYFLVHRLLRRPALTWVTLPLIVAGAAWWLNATAVAANGTSSRLNQLDLLDLDAATGTLHGRTAVTVYPADATEADVSVSPRPVAGAGEAEAPPQLAWSAPAETTFGGTFRETGGGLFRSAYAIPATDNKAASAEQVPLLVWSGRHFVTEWQHGGAAGAFDTDLVGHGRGRLEGRATHRLPGPIKDFYLVYGDRVYLPHEPDWHPGEPIEPASAAFLAQDLSSFLTRRQFTKRTRKPGEGGEDFIVSETAYDPFGTDLDTILRTLTFHEAAGGRAYTGLTNDRLAADDLTPLLRLGRAIVVGTLDAPAADVKVTPTTGSPFETARRTTYVRLVLPVRTAGATDAEPLAPTTPGTPR